jgi:arsenate reductase
MSNLNAPVTIYHNPRCSKSRETLALLEARGLAPTVIEYLKAPPSADELRALLAKLGMKAEQLLRKGDDIYKEKFAGKTLSDEEGIKAMVAHPVLIERPIVVRGDRAVLGRPPERVKELL